LQDREVSGNWLEELPLNVVNRFEGWFWAGHKSPVASRLTTGRLERARFGDSWHGDLDGGQAQP
jgi:hypothetical protein